jgi:hypothetical protein
MTENQQKFKAAQMNLGLLAPPNGTREDYPSGTTTTTTTTTTIIIIIIIIIWHDNPLWFFAFSAKSLQVLLSLAVSFQFFIFSFLSLP